MSAPREPIAIVGIGCRFPGGIDSPDSFWRLLMARGDAIGEIPRTRFDLDAFYDARPSTPGKVSTRFGGFLEDIEGFDADFFRLAPREAERLDPQQRLLLEVGSEALEDAGLPVESLAGSSTGVFVGMWLNDYEGRLFAAPGGADFYMTTGSGRYSASGRLSYLFGLQGPSITIDTACSSSLVAVHLACQSLWAGESDLALAGGANVILQPHISVAYSQSQMLAPDGRCKFGDSRANGYVRSEGAALVTLKALSAARRDGDRVYAVILGGAVNNDGRSGDFMTTPSQKGQEDMLRKAYRSAGVVPGLVRYVEAHGTGTRAGDPVELGALGAVLAESRPKDRPCAVGSVKTNLGHTEGAAGVAGLIKVALSLAHRTIPASLHIVDPSPTIPWDRIPLYVPSAHEPWPETEGPARAGVSAFGISGTNAHLVLEEAPAVQTKAVADGAPAAVSTDQPLHVLLLSAQTPEALHARAGDWQELVAAEDAPALADLCYTASLRRSHHEHRLAIVASSRNELRDRLEAFRKGERRRGTSTGRTEGDESSKLAFVFPGQGSQWLGMARELQRTQAAFREALEACHEAVRHEVEWSLLDELAAPEGRTRLAEIDVVQPALFAIQVALAALWRSWGVLPDAVVGHSMGEVAAAHVSGALSLPDAAAVICRRSRLLRRVSGKGAMAVVGLSMEGAREVLEGVGDRLSIAVSNAPASTVLSGDPEALREILDRLEARDVFCRPVQVDVASHSPQMDPLLPELGQMLRGLRPQTAIVPMYSTVLGGCGEALPLDGDYWCRNLRQPVLFSAAVEQLLAGNHTLFVELSPHPILLPAIEGMLHHLKRDGTVLPSMEREKPEREVALASLGALHTRGVKVDWAHFHPEGRCVPLPTYPWQRKRYWLESGKAAAAAEPLEPGHPVLGRALGSLAPLPGSRIWERTWSSAAEEGHDAARVLGVPVFSAAALLGIAQAAAAETFGPGSYELEDLALETVVALAEGESRVLQTVLTPTEGKAEASVRVFVASARGAEPAWTLAGRTTVRRGEEAALGRGALEDVLARCGAEASPEAHVASLRARGLGFRAGRILGLRQARDEALARMAAAPASEPAAKPSTASSLQECFEVLQAAVREGQLASGVAFVPKALTRFRGVAEPIEGGWVHAVAREGQPSELSGDVRLLDETGRVVAEAIGLRFEPADSPSLEAAVGERVGSLRYEIAWREQAAEARDARPLGGNADFVLLADRGGVASGLARMLRERGDRCVMVFAGAPPEANGDLGVDPLDAQEMERVLRMAKPGARGGVVHLWSLDAPTYPAEDHPLGDGPVVGCLSALHAAQVLARAGSDPRRLWLVTRGAEPVGGALGLAVAQAPIWGFGRVMALEQPASWGGLVDLDPAAPEDEARALLAEVDGGGGEDQVAFRGGRRYVARLARSERRPAIAPFGWRQDGSYLITGGLGGLGLQVARWMAARGAGHLVLTSRSGLPPRTEWDRESPETKAGKQIAAVRGLEALGATVSVLGADAGDDAAMGALFESFGRTRPPLRGVVHAAGILTTETLLALTPATFRAVLQPKVEGAWVLHHRSRSQPLDFFVLFSSGASVWGSKGYAHYAAANHFLDGLAHHRAAAGLKALSVNWGWWAGGGIAGDGGERFFSQIGLEMIPSGQALASLEGLLGDGAVQSTVASVNWGVFKPIYESRSRRPFLAEIDLGSAVEAPTLDADSGLHERLQEARPSDRQEVLATHIATSVAAILGFEAGAAIARRLGFFKMGMDSMMTMQLRTRLERTLGRKLPPTVAFEYPTVDGLAAYLVGEMFSSEAEPTPEPAVPVREEPVESEDLSEEELTVLLAQKLRQSR